MNSKRDYEAMAKILREQRRKTKPDTRTLAYNAALAAVAYAYADIAAERNPLFDRQRFYKAAGIS